MQDIIGRKSERKELDRLYESGRPEFVAVYGRRRVGKTFLVREHFSGRFAFYHTAISPADFQGKKKDLKKEQLRAFCSSIQQFGGDWDEMPNDWFEAFACLREILEQRGETGRKVVFIDELPWMDSGRSGFVSALEHFWNSWGAGRTDLMLIVCGSAASWMNDKIINNTGGLYGRLTYEMHLSPFNLAECEQFYESRGISMDRYDQLQSYMVFGGIPYYLNYLKPENSLAENIDNLFFAKNARLQKEFERLYDSLYSNSEKYIEIVRLLATKRGGFTRKEIAERTSIAYNGRISKMLQSLEKSDFVTSYTYYGGSARNVYYKLVDRLSLFHLAFLDGKKLPRQSFWTKNIRTPELNTWRGLAFEEVCLLHEAQIKKALGFGAVDAVAAPWLSKAGTAQVDLLFDRSDRVVNLCEMKFVSDEFSIDKDYDAELRRQVERFIEDTSCKKSVHLSLVTTYGLVRDKYSSRFQSLMTMDDLFKED